MSFYLDASVIVPNLVEEATSDAVKNLIGRREPQIVVGALAALETSSALSRLVRMGMMTTDEAAERLIRFDTWRGQYDPSLAIASMEIELAGAFVRRFEFSLRGPDALHLAACQRGGHTLVTPDRRLAAAAGALGVETATPA